MTWLLGFVVGVVGCLVFLVLVGWRNEAAVRRKWDLLLTPKGARIHNTLERQLQADMALMQATYDEAFAMRELGSAEEAKELLDIGYRVIEEFAPSLMKLIGAMVTFSHMVSAIAPLQPIPPRRFKLASVASLAYLGQVLHHFLVTTGERFRLRLYIIGHSVGLCVRYTLRSTRRLIAGTTEEEREWEQIQAIRSDLQGLTDESLNSLKALLISLGAEDRDFGALGRR